MNGTAAASSTSHAGSDANAGLCSGWTGFSIGKSGRPRSEGARRISSSAEAVPAHPRPVPFSERPSVSIWASEMSWKALVPPGVGEGSTREGCKGDDIDMIL